MKIQIILGSTRQNRIGDKIAKWAFEKAKKHKDAKFELIDLRDHPLPFYDEVSSLSSLKGNYSHLEAKKWARKVSIADGYIIVTPEYNHGYSAVLKNALDYAYHEWNRKPIAFVSYGGSAGGARAVEQLKQVAVELQMAPVRTGIHIATVWNALDKNEKLKDEEMREKQLDILIEDLLWWTKALKEAKEKSTKKL